MESAQDILTDPDHGYILFDGYCNLCSGAVQFIIPRDPKGYFKFASLQSEWTDQLSEALNRDLSTEDSIVLIEKGRVYRESTAVLRIARKMKGLWPAFSILLVLPRGLRDGLYRWIARNRFNWFGQREQCMAPTPEVKNRFLSQSEAVA